MYLNNVCVTLFHIVQGGYDYDNLPCSIIKDRFSNVMQIPIHPISIGRLNRSHYSSNEMIEYYSNVLKINYVITANYFIFSSNNNF